MTKKRAKAEEKPFFKIHDYSENPTQSIFDLIEWRFYDTAPKLVGINGSATIKDNQVYIDYSLGQVDRLAYKKFVVDAPLWRRLVARSYTLQNKIYSLLFLEGLGDHDDPRGVFQLLIDYYFPQQFLRVFVSPHVINWLQKMGVDPREIGYDETPVMDSPEPRHRGTSALGFKGALRDVYKPVRTNEELIRKLAGRGLDYLAKVIDHIRILSWAQYFAQTEDAYVFGLISDYIRQFGHNKDFDYYRRVIGNVRFKL